MKKNIAIITGGDSSEIVVSLKSATTVKKHLNNEKFDAFIVKIQKSIWKVETDGIETDIDKNDFSFTYKGQKITFDCAFMAIHGTPGEDGKLQGYFDVIGLPYTSCNVLASAITFNKWYCNTLLKQTGCNTAKSILLRETEMSSKKIVAQLGLPCFVKPNNGGSSFGVTKVKKEEDIQAAIVEAFKHGTEVIIEAFVDGTEVTCGCFCKEGKIIALPITEIVSEREFFDYVAKYEGASQEITPARISKKLTQEVQETTRSIYNTLNLSGFIRADFLINKQDQVFLIEVNTIPGLSEASLIPQQAREAGIPLSELFENSIKEALKRS